MVRNFRFALALVAGLAFLFLADLGKPQNEAGRPARRLITQAVDRSRMVVLPGNTRSEATATNDRGPVANNLPMEHMQLQLRLPAEKQQELDQLTRDQQDPKSPNYHKWLTPDQFKQQFSLAPEDIDAITAWLQSEGFTVNAVNPTTIDFSGTAGQVRNAFRTEIHNLNVNGANHIANMSDPQIPVALEPAVVGIVSLNDFKPRPLNRRRAEYTPGNGEYLVVPADLATIYTFNPLFAAGYSGQGQTIVVIEDSDVYSTADWNTFRSTFGLATAYPGGSFIQAHPPPPVGSTNTCTDPGVDGGDDAEAILDSEWASAAAPSATIELASCADTSTNFGGFIALQNLLNSGTPPAIVSISYGDPESELGATFNAHINSLYEQAVSEGVSIFVSAGDQGAAGADDDATSATHGIAVSGFTSTPYNVSVGGTDFGDAFAGSNSTYWNSGNTVTYASAKSYVPEIPWNDSCASMLIATHFGFGTTYGSGGFCNSSTGQSFTNTAAGSGGPSGCATGAPAINGVVGGTCAGYAKPSWQSVLGNPSDGVRDIPDVSLFSANGVWGHYYVVCYSDPSNGGAPCTGAPDNWSGFGGTSISSPIMAGIQALVNQKTGERQGNPNFAYYSLAASEYGSAGNSTCNSTLGNGTASTCIFYDVTQGDMNVNCTGTHNCYIPSGANGVLSTSNSTYQPAFGTATGWDFATGIGTVNAYNLVNNWPGTSVTATSGTPQSATINTAFGAPLVAVVKDSNSNPLSGVTVTFTAPGNGASGTFAGGATTATTNASGVATSAIFTANATAGSYTVVATATGVPGTASFVLTNTAGSPASIAAMSGTPQSAAINAAFFSPLVAVVKDAGGNPVSVATVTFTVPGSGASGSFAGGVNTETTNASGAATSGTLTANGTAGNFTVVASVTGVAGTASFSLSNSATAPASITATSGTPQNTTILTAFGAPLVATVKNISGNPVSGAIVQFVPTGSGASGSFAGGVNTAMTNGAGVATSATFTANAEVGSYIIHASVPGATGTANFTLSNNTGPAANIVSTNASQITTINSSFPFQLSTTVTDAGGNGVSGVNVTFTAPGSGASGSFAGGVNTATTNGAGVATSATFTANGVGGRYTVTAAAAGVASATSFSLTNVDFDVVMNNPGTVQITPGTPVTVTLNLVTIPANAPLPADIVSTCAVPAALTGTQCAINPADIPAGSTKGNSTVTILTTAGGIANSRSAPPAGGPGTWPHYMQWLTIVVAMLAMMGILMVACEEGLAPRRLPAYLTMATLAIAAVGLMSCGSGVTSGTSSTFSTTSSTMSPSNTGTPIGSSSVTVTSVVGGVTKTMTINVNVN